MREVRPQRLRFDPVAGFSVPAVAPWARLAIAPGACFISDGLSGFAVLDQLGYEHNIRHALARQDLHRDRRLPLAQRGIGNLKTALCGKHHTFKFAKFARRSSWLKYSIVSTAAATWWRWCRAWPSLRPRRYRVRNGEF